ncbi:MAG: hypothetical protein GKC10_08685, partial [Methanosarcinales archaeon]|nr:hypothetical protein [Methanosarcinales archaeon]
MILWTIRKSSLFWITSRFGKVCRWLDRGWRAPLVLLFDVTLAVVVLRGAFFLLADALLPKIVKLNAGVTSTILFNRSPVSLSNASPLIKSNVSPFLFNASPLSSNTSNQTLVNGSVSIGTFHGGAFTEILANEGLFIHGRLIDLTPFDQALALILDTLWFHWQEILVVWLLFEILQNMARASNRLSINFIEAGKGNGSGGSENDKSKGTRSNAEGLTDLLVLHLNRINELYRVVDERRAIPSASGPGRPVDANIKTDESELIPENTDQAFKLWNIQIPVNLILKLAVRLMNGPRITISLRTLADGKSVLIANMVGRRGSQSWLVESTTKLTEESRQEEKPREVEEMVKELAYRIHAFLAFGDANRVSKWRARYQFAEGLRFYRNALVSTSSRYYSLKLAEDNFMRAIEEDNSFALAYYNLGVVYAELGQMEAANSAFTMATECDSQMAEAYYALAMNIYSMAESCEDDLCRLYDKIPGLVQPDSTEKINAGNASICRSMAAASDDGNAWLSSQRAEDFFKIKIKIPSHSQRSLALEYKKVISLSDHAIKILKAKANPLNWDYEKLSHAYNLKGNARRHLAAVWMNEEPHSS